MVLVCTVFWVRLCDHSPATNAVFSPKCIFILVGLDLLVNTLFHKSGDT